MMPIICYVAVLVGSMAIATVVYTSVMLGWCGFSLRLPHPTSAGSPETKNLNFSPYLASRFKYTEGIEKGEAAIEQESCVVCLSGFKDGEYVCRLPNCKHSFHSPCIDMWLYSHSNCPVCRAPVDRVDCLNRALATEENSRELLLDISILS